jgi:hypothetical protein
LRQFASVTFELADFHVHSSTLRLGQKAWGLPRRKASNSDPSTLAV